MAVLTPELRAEAEGIVARYPEGRERSAIMPLLYLVQSVQGQVTRDGLREVAEILGATTAEIEAVASFYTMLRLRPTGTHVVSVCTNLSCALRGARDVYERGRRVLDVREGETSDDGMVTLHEEECLGACDAAPVVTVDFVNFDRMTPEGMEELLSTLRGGGTPTSSRGEFPGDFKAASRILAGLPTDAGTGGSGGSSSEREGASGSPPGETA